jgi:F420H(2)-dependent quinone reductase
MILNWLFRLFMRLQISIFRSSNGKRMASMGGLPVLLLTTVGRKTGQARTTPLGYFRDGEYYVIIASNNGRDSHPAWFYNLKAAPRVTIEVPGSRLQVVATTAEPAERERLWAQLIALAPNYDAYRKKTTRQIPIVLLKPV